MKPIRLPDGSQTEDTVPEDQSLVLDNPQGLVIIFGCGHAGIVNTLEYAQTQVRKAPVHAVLGGFHLFEATVRTAPVWRPCTACAR